MTAAAVAAAVITAALGSIAVLQTRSNRQLSHKNVELPGRPPARRGRVGLAFARLTRLRKAIDENVDVKNRPDLGAPPQDAPAAPKTSTANSGRTSRRRRTRA